LTFGYATSPLQGRVRAWKTVWVKYRTVLYG
jgi:hypothetical protein